MQIKSLDHLVLTVNNIEVTVDFYTRILGMQKEIFSGGRVALKFAQQKINLHQKGSEFMPNATTAVPGSADLCMLIDCNLLDAMQVLQDSGVDIIEGPVPRTGATGPIDSIYFRDPDGNLLELSTIKK